MLDQRNDRKGALLVLYIIFFISFGCTPYDTIYERVYTIVYVLLKFLFSHRITQALLDLYLGHIEVNPETSKTFSV